MPFKTVAAFTSLYWMSGISALTGSLISGQGRIVCKKFDPVKIWKWIEDYKVCEN